MKTLLLTIALLVVGLASGQTPPAKLTHDEEQFIRNIVKFEKPESYSVTKTKSLVVLVLVFADSTTIQTLKDGFCLDYAEIHNNTLVVYPRESD